MAAPAQPSTSSTSRAVTGRESASETWSWGQDYIYGGGRLLASALPDGTERHYHADHLGNIRAITDENGVKLSTHHYYPYGLEWSDPSASDERMRFTGHERDNGDGGTAYVTDYMHARYYSPLLGRFGRVDPLRGSPGSPQSLNRYAYTAGNPLNYVDPDGQSYVTATRWTISLLFFAGSRVARGYGSTDIAAAVNLGGAGMSLSFSGGGAILAGTIGGLSGAVTCSPV